MNWAEWFLVLLGAVIALSVAAASCLWCISYVLDWFQKTDWRSFAAGREDGKDSLRQRLQGDAWWFSESPETTRLIQDLAEGRNVSDARDRWRESRQAKEGGALA